MTKCIVLGVDNSRKKKNPIIFNNFIDENKNISHASTPPSLWDNIELISLNYRHTSQDLMFAYNDDRNNGSLYFGHWNDGTV